MTVRRPSFWSRPAAPLAMGIAACAACCAAPIAAIVVGAGAASSLALWLEPIAGLLLAVAAGLGIAWYVRGQRAHAGAASCAVDGSCGCGPARTAEAADLGCTLDDRDLPQRLDAFRALFSRALLRRRAPDAHAEWILAWSPDVEADARALTAAELACCGFFEFDLRRDGDELRWTATAPPDRRRAIALLDDLAIASLPAATHAA